MKRSWLERAAEEAKRRGAGRNAGMAHTLRVCAEVYCEMAHIECVISDIDYDNLSDLVTVVDNG